MSNGKGDTPRNLGPKFRENYDAINWQRTINRERLACERAPLPAATEQAQRQAAETKRPAATRAVVG